MFKAFPWQTSGPLTRSTKLLWYVAASLMTIGLISRLAPLFSPSRRLNQFPTEDGYLMLTIARNIGLGHGMSTADGTIPTNGTQPLFTLIQSVGFWLVGGDKTAGVVIALVLQVLFSLAAATLLFLLAASVLRQREQAQEMAALTTGLWYASAIVVPNSMNCLETGLYSLLVLLSVFVWHQHEQTALPPQLNIGFAVILGVLLGLTFWARNDAVFLVAAIAGWHTLLGVIVPAHRLERLRRLGESLIMGLTSLAVVSPWLAYNQLNFGSIVPISGTAQSVSASFGSNAAHLPGVLWEYTSLILPLPGATEQIPLFLLITSFVAIIYLVVLGFAAVCLMRPQERVLFYVAATYGAFLIFYYGFLFGAPYFLGRYLFPLSPFFALFSVAFLAGWVRSWPDGRLTKYLLPYGGIFMLILVGLLNLRLYMLGTQHPHAQVVSWVNENVSESTWVGAVQTGTLGFFHDRTINLDGKVNPQALAALLKRQIPTYVVETTFDDQGGKIEYLADWVGIEGWIELEPIKSHFEVVLVDKQKNLAVLRRKVS
ncbi:hypothetical protein [Trichothermofontia sp.]